MENKFFKFLKLDGLLEGVKGYIDARIQLFVLETQEKAANVIASLMFIALTAFCFLIMLAFLSVALGIYLNELFGNTYLGFVVMGVFYLILLLVLAININKGFLHRKVKNTIKNSFSKKKNKDERSGSGN